jgi:hypothetical protein
MPVPLVLLLLLRCCFCCCCRCCWIRHRRCGPECMLLAALLHTCSEPPSMRSPTRGAPWSNHHLPSHPPPTQMLPTLLRRQRRCPMWGRQASTAWCARSGWASGQGHAPPAGRVGCRGRGGGTPRATQKTDGRAPRPSMANLALRRTGGRCTSCGAESLHLSITASSVGSQHTGWAYSADVTQ